METSPTIAKLAAALTDFQAAVPSVLKDSTNPFFKSKYATLENFINTIKPHLKKSGLSYSQLPDADGLTTVIMHSSGEWLKATASLHLSKQDPQGQGSAITYMRRYALGAALGLATEEDDDGNAASKPMKPYQMKRTVPAEDDEAGGAVIQTDPPKSEADEKKEIMRLLTKLRKPTKTKKLCEDAVFDIAGVTLTPENYPTIIERLELSLKGE